MPDAIAAVDVIRAKRDGRALSDEQIRWFLDAYTAGTVADEQAAALLMAVVWRGLDERELATWTDAMVRSGERLDLSSLRLPTVDKHSTGGVGDKVSLILCPLVAACGAAVPQLSGRGLGHTGGTLDKLESIPGFRTDLANDAWLAQLDRIGCVISAPSPTLAPADRKLYRLRDVTGTVESIPLIASSIMSKKIAEGTASLVLNVTSGSGAFMRDPADARRLADTMVGIGTRNGVHTVAVLSDMDEPLGTHVGNALEVQECLDVLDGRAGPGSADLVEITLALAREMLSLCGIGADPAEALSSGAARARWDEMVRAQGGDPSVALPRSSDVRPALVAPTDGWVGHLDALAVGTASWRLGAGRARKEDPVSPIAGVVCLRKHGDRVRAGEPVLELHVDDPARVDAAMAALEGALTVVPAPPMPRALVRGVVRARPGNPTT